MGIFIHMNISKSVTKDEWQKVYEETLLLVKAFPLAESRKVYCKGIETICLVPTEEREDFYGWNYNKKRVGWFADGDYETMHTAEDYALFRNLVCEEEIDENAGDAILGVLSDYMNDYNKALSDNVYCLWGNKTQGEPYHMYLLAIACLIESRLNEKAFIYGDITRGQCKKAVELANQYLNNPIEIPARCDVWRFHERISKLPIGKKAQYEAFVQLYMGTKDAEFGAYIRSVYPEEIYMEYWKEEFDYYPIGTLGFDRIINEYLLCGFGLKELCSLVNYLDKEEKPQYQKFVERILDANLHIKEKNCEDMLKINQEEEEPYSIYTLFAQFAFAGAENKKVDRYIPIEEIKSILTDTLGDKCNVEFIIDEYLQREKNEIVLSAESSETEFKALCEQDASEALKQMMDIKKQALCEDRRKYTITVCEDFIYYRAGDSIEPHLEAALHNSFAFYNGLVAEERFHLLMKKSAKERCEWLAEQNKYLLIRKTDWEKIFTDIEKNDLTFARYYPMVRVKMETNKLVYMVMSFVLNDELYQYCKSVCQE